MRKAKYANIQDFSTIKEKCIFCETKMRVHLSNFLGLRPSGMPLFNSPIKNGKITFDIDRTTDSGSLQATGVIDILTNDVSITASTDMDLSEIADRARRELYEFGEQHFAALAFNQMSPHIELYCPNKKCKLQYTLSSDIIVCRRDHSERKWTIDPFILFQETFATSTLWVQNDYFYNRTNIYPLENSNFATEPIKVPLMDFNSMDKDKLLTRVKTLVVFS